MSVRCTGRTERAALVFGPARWAWAEHFHWLAVDRADEKWLVHQVGSPLVGSPQVDNLTADKGELMINTVVNQC